MTRAFTGAGVAGVIVSRGRTIWTGIAHAVAPSPGATVATRFVVPARYARQVTGAFFAVGIAART